MLVDKNKKEINCKIVYYGPALSGKTTNLKYIHKRLKPDHRGELVSVDTKGERTLFFDFLPVEIPLPRGFKLRFHLYTVPGQFFYQSSRKLVLRGADGLVYVADSSASRRESNVQIMKEMLDVLKLYKMKLIEEVPLIIQYNKRDLPDAMPVEELEKLLNPWGVPYVEAVAVSGVGVFQTLDLIVKEVMKRVIKKTKVA